MRKKLLNTKLWLITMMLALFSSGAWAEDELYSTCLFGGTHGTSNNYTSTWTATNGTFSWSVSNGNTNGAKNGWNYVKFGRKSYTSIGIVQTSAAYTEAITKVDITIDNINASKINSITLYTSSNGSSWSSAGTFTKTTGTKTVSLSSPAANLYYKIEFDCASGSSNGLISVSKIEFYKEKAAIVATALSVKTTPTKVNYRVGEKLDLTGLVLSATIGGTPTDVTSGYTSKINSTTVTSGSTTLSTVGAHDIEFSYGGQTTTQTIHVGELKGIEVTTDPTKTTYDEGQTFDATGMVVTATFSDKETSETTWDAVIPLKVGTADGYTFSPDDELETTDDNVEVSYTWGDVTKTDNVSITVNAAVPYTVTFNKGTGTCATTFLTEASAKAGVELPTATIGITGWAFAGWATSSVTNTGDEPTLYDAGDTYYPSDNITLYAVYKFSYKSSTIFTRATSVSDITSADKIVIAYNDGKVLNTSINLSTSLSESSGKVTPASNAIFTLSGDNTNGFTLTNGTYTIGTSGTGVSLNIALSSTNNLWTFSPSTYGTNLFHVNNVNASGKSLEVYQSAWKAYALTENGQAWSMRVYVPVTDYVYNSNPAAMINPSVAFTTAGNKSLYVQDEASYPNAANVTGIA
ncbi:MAG: InlB B-repeat-containing protein, partial [Bacteroidaceae bacterium]|nr:InlB B-repeat-containing protein [Bacteroidaceae bacterium]